MKDGDVLCVISSGADAEWRGSVKGWVLFVEEETANKAVEVCLANIFLKHLERASGILKNLVKRSVVVPIEYDRMEISYLSSVQG